MILKLIHSTNDLIHTDIKPFDFDNDDPIEIFNNLRDTMIEFGGVGLAANQCGINSRVIVYGFPDNPENVRIMFNPVIVSMSIKKSMMEEGCLTFPGLFPRIKRASEIRVRFQNINGDTETISLGGITSRIVSHEIDHLNGIVFTKRADRFHLEQARRQQKRRNKESK